MQIVIDSCCQKRFDGGEDKFAYLTIGEFKTQVTSLHKARRFMTVAKALVNRVQTGRKIDGYDMSQGIGFYCNSTVREWKPWASKKVFYSDGNSAWGTLEEMIKDYLNRKMEGLCQ